MRQEAGNLVREHGALAHVGDVGRAPLAEADQHAALLLHPPHGGPRAVPVAPLLAVDDRQQAFGLHLADTLEAVLQPALLRRHLRALVGVLRGAAAADAEMRAARLAPARAVVADRGGRADVELAALLEDPHLGVLARQRAL